MTKFKPILLDETTYDRISKMAHDNGRTRAGQVRIMVDAFEIMHIKSVTVLPHPDGANPVPVITIESEPK